MLPRRDEQRAQLFATREQLGRQRLGRPRRQRLGDGRAAGHPGTSMRSIFRGDSAKAARRQCSSLANVEACSRMAQERAHRFGADGDVTAAVTREQRRDEQAEVLEPLHAAAVAAPRTPTGAPADWREARSQPPRLGGRRCVAGDDAQIVPAQRARRRRAAPRAPARPQERRLRAQRQIADPVEKQVPPWRRAPGPAGRRRAGERALAHAEQLASRCQSPAGAAITGTERAGTRRAGGLRVRSSLSVPVAPKMSTGMSVRAISSSAAAARRAASCTWAGPSSGARRAAARHVQTSSGSVGRRRNCRSENKKVRPHRGRTLSREPVALDAGGRRRRRDFSTGDRRRRRRALRG